MPLTNPSDLRAFLDSLGASPKKGLSQNFLIDGNIIRKIIQEASVSANDTILEIGPGPGALTEVLVQQGCKILAVEMDRTFAKALHRFEGVEVFAEDILKFDLSRLPAKSKVVSNLPYHLTAPILGRLAPRTDLFSTITVMVQEEVARRMTAKPKTKDYGSFTVFLNFYSNPRYAFKVSRNCFYPRPKVDSAIVTLTLHAPPPVDATAFFNLVRTAFQQRRKMLKSTLKRPEIGSFLEALEENPQSRPEDLSIDVFLKLTQML